MKKIIRDWSFEKLSSLSNEEFIDLFVLSLESRTILRDGDLTIENKIKNCAPGESIDLCNKEAFRRKIPFTTIAERLASRAKAGNSFVSNLVAPSNWRKFEIQTAKAVIAWVEQDGFKLDKVDFDARILGRVTKVVCNPMKSATYSEINLTIHSDETCHPHKPSKSNLHSYTKVAEINQAYSCFSA